MKRGSQPANESKIKTAANPEPEAIRHRRGGFAVHPELASQAGRKGGVEAHRRGTAHRWTSEEARAAGSKGGATSRGGGRPRKSQSATEA